jgi:hypothetical protein
MVKRSLLVLLACITLAIFVTPSSAVELWDPHLRGVNEGLAAGALPPQGFYFINNSYWANYQAYDHNGDTIPGVNLNAYVDVPILLWSTGWKFLGADYGVAIAQPFDYTNLETRTFRDPASGNYYNTSRDNWGTYNTVLVPAILAWSLPYDFHVAGSFAVYMNDASTSPGNHPSGESAAWSGNNFWTFEPGIGVSWLHDGWNISADFHISINTQNTDTHYWTAPEFWADYTIAKTIGKWTLGVGAYQQNQISNDTNYGTVPYSKVANFGMGPLLGYNFGPVIVQASYNWGIVTKNDVGGDWFNFRVIVPLKLPF